MRTYSVADDLKRRRKHREMQSTGRNRAQHSEKVINFKKEE